MADLLSPSSPTDPVAEANSALARAGDGFGIKFPPNMPPDRVVQITQSARKLYAQIRNSKLPDGVRATASQAFRQLQKAVEAAGGQFVATSPSTPAPGAPLPVSTTPPPGGFPKSEQGVIDVTRVQDELGIGGGSETPMSPTTMRPIGAGRGLWKETRVSSDPVEREIEMARMEATAPGLPAPGLAPKKGLNAAGLAAMPGGARGRTEPYAISGEPGTFTPATGGEEPAPVPQTPEIDTGYQESEDILNLRRALAEPMPKRQKRNFTMTEGIALSFLAGLKGIEAAMPYMALREQETERDYQAALTERQGRVSGLAGLAQLSEQSKARHDAMLMRKGQVEWNRQMQAFSMEMKLRADARSASHLDLAMRASERADARYKRLNPDFAAGIADLGELVRGISDLERLVDAGAGGPFAAGVFQTQRWSPDTVTAAAMWGNMRTLLSPRRIGRAGTGIEISGLASDFFNIGIANMRGRQLAVLREMQKYALNTVHNMAAVYDAESVYKAAGLWPDATRSAAASAQHNTMAPLPEGAMMVPEADVTFMESAEDY